jgi:hypothetical protein
MDGDQGKVAEMIKIILVAGARPHPWFQKHGLEWLPRSTPRGQYITYNVVKLVK